MEGIPQFYTSYPQLKLLTDITQIGICGKNEEWVKPHIGGKSGGVTPILTGLFWKPPV